MKQELKRFAIEGDFVLASGANSKIYLHIKKAYGEPELLNAISDSLYGRMPANITCVSGMGKGAEPIAATISSRHGLRLSVVRSKLKDHGVGGSIEYYVPSKMDLVAVVDDVFTTGKSLEKNLEILNSTGAQIVGGYVVVKRGEGKLSVPLHYLFTLDELLN